MPTTPENHAVPGPERAAPAPPPGVTGRSGPLCLLPSTHKRLHPQTFKNAFAEAFNSLFKAELTATRAPGGASTASRSPSPRPHLSPSPPAGCRCQRPRGSRTGRRHTVASPVRPGSQTAVVRSRVPEAASTSRGDERPDWTAQRSLDQGIGACLIRRVRAAAAAAPRMTGPLAGSRARPSRREPRDRDGEAAGNCSPGCREPWQLRWRLFRQLLQPACAGAAPGGYGGHRVPGASPSRGPVER